ncbi:MAG: serine/threonine-protein kinase [Kofleriaceae bacterium]
MDDEATRREGQGTRPQPDADDGVRLEKGASLGRYMIIDILGAGGMGVVYSAFDPELDRKVAIKILQANAGGSESGGQSWLVREAQAMARLAHPNVVAVYDVGAVSGDQVFVAMELIDGDTLRNWLKTERSWQDIVPVMRAAGAGLAAAHRAGLVHRDFKPDNVLVGNDGRVRVMDFGLARLAGHEPQDVKAARTSDLSIETRSPLSERLTATGAVLGTPAYMAPEIYAAQGADARADQFAFGVAMYEALYRERPFDRDALVAGKAVPPKVPPSKVPAWLERIVLKAVALDAAQRYPSMDALLADLSRDRTSKKLWIVAALLVVIAAGGIGAAFAMRKPVVVACSDAPTTLAHAWGPFDRFALAGAFGQVNKSFAIAGTEKALDAYADQWVAMRTEACKATRVGGSQSDEVLTVRNQCLDQRLAELGTVVKLFEQPDPTMPLGAVGAVQKLSAIADCGDTQALLTPDPLPKDPAAREHVAVLQQKLSEARATYKASRPKDALAMIEKLGPDVLATAHHPTMATYHFLHGQTLWVLQGAAVGEPELKQAVIDAEAGKADETRLEALLQLTNLANDGAKFDVAAERLQQAAAALARLNDKWDDKVRVLDANALLESRQGHFDKAIALAKQARSLTSSHPNTMDDAYATLVEASIYASSGRPTEAIADFEHVLAFYEAYGTNRIEVATVLQSLGSVEMLLGKLDDAYAHLSRALATAEVIYGHESIDVAEAMRGVAVLVEAKRDYVKALAMNREALAIIGRIAGEDSDRYAAMLTQLAQNFIDEGKFEDAIPYLDRALKIQVAKFGEGHLQTLTTLLSKCDALEAAKQHAVAVETCKHALAVAEKTFGKSDPLLSLFLFHTGAMLVDSEPKQARVLLDRAVALGNTNPSQVAEIQFYDAQARWRTGDKKGAHALAKQARDFFQSAGPGNEATVKEVDDWLRSHKT